MIGTDPRIFDPPSPLAVALEQVHHGVHELWSADRDFGRSPALKVRNPLVE